jgi:hypothetical protein
MKNWQQPATGKLLAWLQAPIFAPTQLTRQPSIACTSSENVRFKLQIKIYLLNHICNFQFIFAVLFFL